MKVDLNPEIQTVITAPTARMFHAAAYAELSDSGTVVNNDT